MSAPEHVFFLPGAGGNPSFWKPVAESIRLAAPQRFFGWPGFGDQPFDPLVSGLDDLATIVTRSANGPCALVAQSMGGVVALLAAIRQPQRFTHLVLVATSGGIDMSDLHAQDWRTEFMAQHPHLPRWFSDYRVDLSADLPQVKMPVLLIWGDSDPISPVTAGQRLASLLPNSDLHIVAGGQHDLAQVHAATVARLIDDHLVQG